jgi:hypothetical protein
MKQHRSLNTGKHTFVVDISTDPRHIDQAARPFITAHIHRSDKPEQTWKWQGYLLPEMNVSFELLFKDHIDIKGSLFTQHPDGIEQDDVLLKASFGRNLIEQYEGKLLRS